MNELVGVESGCAHLPSPTLRQIQYAAEITMCTRDEWRLCVALKRYVRENIAQAFALDAYLYVHLILIRLVSPAVVAEKCLSDFFFVLLPLSHFFVWGKNESITKSRKTLWSTSGAVVIIVAVSLSLLLLFLRSPWATKIPQLICFCLRWARQRRSSKCMLMWAVCRHSRPNDTYFSEVLACIPDVNLRVPTFASTSYYT